jgi:hypothetical protein
MKKVNNQNPLKTFNDNYAARAKKVVEGNKKLVKAQVGKVVENNDNKYTAKQKAEHLKNILKEGYKPDNKYAADPEKGIANPEDTLTNQYFTRKRPNGSTQILGVKKYTIK